jgi:hypothetical protein
MSSLRSNCGDFAGFRYAVACLLFVAAIFKSSSPNGALVLTATLGVPKNISGVLVPFECLLGWGLLLNIWPSAIYRIVTLVFSSFALFSFYRGIEGYDSCGCFGSLEVSPWLSCGIDVFVAFFSKRCSAIVSAKNAALALSIKGVLVGCIGTIISLVALNWLTASVGIQIPVAGVAYLEPSKWVNSEFPLTKLLEPQVDLDSGNWKVVLYHHDCSICQDSLPSYVEYAASRASERVLLVEFPPVRDMKKDFGKAIYAFVPPDREWFVHAPVEISLKDGIVHYASQSLPSISSSDSRGQGR